MTWRPSRHGRCVLAALLLCLVTGTAGAASVQLLGSTGGGAGAPTEFTVKTQVLIIMTLLGLLPVMALMMTMLTRPNLLRRPAAARA